MKRDLLAGAAGGLLLGFLAVGMAGCGGATGTTPETAVTNASGAAVDSSGLPSDDEILRQIDEALEYTYEKRRLSVNEQAAWQIIHGALAFKREFLVSDGTQDVSAVNYVLAGGKMKGWNLRRGDLLDESTMRYGVKALVDEDKQGQGHCDQWMGYLSDCHLPLDETVMVEGQPHTIQDWIDQIQLDVVENPTDEYSWTLMCLTAYYPTDYTWKAKDGSEWSIEKLVEIELGHDLDQSACGGTHRMTGMTMAYNRRLAAGKPMEGVWAQLGERIKECQRKAREYQNEDGSLSSNYFARPGKAADLALMVGSAGHVMEFLATSMDKEELQQEWVKRAVLDVCKVFRKTKAVDVECGALFHAAHGLVLYREKVYGPRTFGKTEPAAVTAAKP
ncbi:MAG TPA: ADP-ribosylation factor-directed GTPase activating protein isoform b [Pirellulaceae bacterium]|nr:ADP-ribosylation factor-directed GTPase activating protein isoform b [Pirellulaceae bacterium]